MAATITKTNLTQLPSGGASLLTTAAALLHTLPATTSATNYDEIWLYACNYSTTSQNLTIGWNGNLTSIVVSVPGQQGLLLVVPGLVLAHSTANHPALYATAGATSAINVVGFVNRITQ